MIGSPLAEVPGTTVFRLAQAIGNSLGNRGDRLALLAADGWPVDAFSYGDDTTHLAGACIHAPGTGRSIERRFGVDSAFRDAAILADPSPGRAPAPQRSAAPPTASAPDADSEVRAVDVTAWLVLLTLGTGLLGRVGWGRLAARARRRGAR